MTGWSDISVSLLDLEMSTSNLPKQRSPIPATNSTTKKRRRRKNALKPNNLQRFNNLMITIVDNSVQVTIDGRSIDMSQVKKDLNSIVPSSEVDDISDVQQTKQRIKEGYQYLAIHFMCHTLIYYNHNHNMQYNNQLDHTLLAGAHSLKKLKQVHPDKKINTIYNLIYHTYVEELGGIEEKKGYFQRSSAFDNSKIKRRRIQHKIKKRENNGAYNQSIKKQWSNGDERYALNEMCQRLNIVNPDPTVRRVTLVMRQLAKNWKVFKANSGKNDPISPTSISSNQQNPV